MNPEKPTQDNEKDRALKKSETGAALKRSVSFNKLVKVVLIPEVVEYRAAKIHSHLWYTPEQLNEFKETARVDHYIKGPANS